MYLKIIFGLIAFGLTVLLVLRELGITKKLSPMRASEYVSVIAGFMIAYIITAIIIVFKIGDLTDKAIMLFFAISPFVIGKLVTYEKVKIYSIIQILCVILSLGYVFFI